MLVEGHKISCGGHLASLHAPLLPRHTLFMTYIYTHTHFFLSFIPLSVFCDCVSPWFACRLLFNLHSGCVRVSPSLIHLCLFIAPKPRSSRSHQRQLVNQESASLICSVDQLIHLCQVIHYLLHVTHGIDGTLSNFSFLLHFSPFLISDSLVFAISHSADTYLMDDFSHASGRLQFSKCCHFKHGIFHVLQPE